MFTGFLISLLALPAISATVSLGLGAQNLKNFHGKFLHKEHLTNTLRSSSCTNVTEYYYADAVLDNFAPIQKQQKWYGKGQRYWINREFWQGPGAPIFVFIGGEGEESCSRLTDYLYMYQLAQEHRALLVDVEHRFYGQSIPTPDTSTPNLQYLSSEQALADLARVITHVKEDLQTTSSVVVTVGGSYPGNLAAWFRLKYPSVTQGSIASSAPVHAQTSFPEYMDVVAQGIVHISGQSCYNNLQLAAEVIASLALQGPATGGYSKLQTDFNTCSPLKDDKGISILLSDLMGNVQGTVQYNEEQAAAMNISNICSIMTTPQPAYANQADVAYANFVTLQAAYRKANGQNCEDGNYADTIAVLSATGAARSWTYQTCNEFGYYQTADSKNQPFAAWKTWLNLNLSRSLCYDAFNGWTTDPQVAWTNTVYGATVAAATNVVFPSGSIDPWHALGVSNTTAPLPSRSEVKVFIEGTAHCKDLYAPNAASDPASLTYARQVIHDQVSYWIKSSTAPHK